MKRLLLALMFSVLLIFLTQTASAGISLGKGNIIIPAGQSGEFCDVWIYATQEGGTYTVETTGDIGPLTTEISPNGFPLDAIDCPEDSRARRACISELCQSESPACEIVCVKFTAPLIFGNNQEEVVYEGAILSNIRIGAATIKEPFEFSVHVVPMDITPLVAGIVVLGIIIVVLIVYFRKKK